MAPSSAPRAAAETGSDPQYRLRLYVAGDLPNSVQARENLRDLCETHLAGRAECEVIDYLQHPARALADGILVTPTLIKVAPAPTAVVVGSLADRQAVLRALGITPAADG